MRQRSDGLPAVRCMLRASLTERCEDDVAARWHSLSHPLHVHGLINRDVRNWNVARACQPEKQSRNSSHDGAPPNRVGE